MAVGYALFIFFEDFDDIAWLLGGGCVMAESGCLDHVVYFDVIFNWKGDHLADLFTIFVKDMLDIEIG